MKMNSYRAEVPIKWIWIILSQNGKADIWHLILKYLAHLYKWKNSNVISNVQSEILPPLSAL